MSARERAATLLADMTFDEKVALALADFAAVAHLGIPPLVYTDGGSGVRGADGVTAFPAAIALAATFDPALAAEYGGAVAEEARGKGHNVLLGPAVDIARVPTGGRVPEAFGEDPYLAAALVVPEVEAIQSRHVIAMVKHFVANNFETGRTGYALPEGRGPAVNAVVGERALHEIYLPPFRAAAERGRAGAVMGSYNRLNGPFVCEHPGLFALLKGWDWHGFVAPDFKHAVRDPVAAARAGLDIPGLEGAAGRTAEAFRSGRIPPERLDDIAGRILFAMFDAGLAEHPLPEDTAAPVATPEHAELATRVAVAGTVVLRNDGALPLDGVGSLAVIGPAGLDAAYVIGGSAGVRLNPERVITPLAGIVARAGDAVRVEHAQGSAGDVPLPPAPLADVRAEFWHGPEPAGPPARTEAAETVAVPDGLPPVFAARWTATLTPPEDGLHRLSLTFAGVAELFVDDVRVAAGYREAIRFVEGPELPLQAAVELRAGVPARLRIEYWTGAAIAVPQIGMPGPAMHVGWQPPGARIDDAAALARRCDAAVVLANDVSGEGMDRASLSLPGDQDALIAAVAAANPRTVVVLNTAGPVLMPWLEDVAAVVQAWYPGQQFGAALAAVVFGDADPGGRLPITFPASPGQGPIRRPEQYPGVDGDAVYDEGVLVGYRHHDAHGEDPLFAFGHGLSYAAFDYADLIVGDGTVSAAVTNVAGRPGTEVAQLYVATPGGPPAQMKGIHKLRLAPGETARAEFPLPREALATYDDGWVVRPGRYGIMVGRSARDLRLRADLTL